MPDRPMATPPLPAPFLTKQLRDYFQDKKSKEIIGPQFGVLAISVSRVPSTSEMGVLEPVHELILGGGRGPVPPQDQYVDGTPVWCN